MENQILSFIEVWLVLLLTFLTYYYGIRKLIIKYYQQHLFTLRDKLFIIYHSEVHNEATSDLNRKILRDGYDILRNVFNTSIKLADTFNFIDIMLMKRLYKNEISEMKFVHIEENKNFKYFIENNSNVNEIYRKFENATIIFSILRQPIYSLYKIFTFIIFFSFVMLYSVLIKTMKKYKTSQADNKYNPKSIFEKEEESLVTTFLYYSQLQPKLR